MDDYIIENRSQLADAIGVKESYITYLLYKKGIESLYVKFQIPKKNGDMRDISAPKKELKQVQSNILKYLRIQKMEYDKENKIIRKVSHGFVKECSFLTNAREHVGYRYTINVDIKDFFPSFNFGRVRGYFIKHKAFKMEPGVATVFANLCCYNNELPQGAPTSPEIANLIFETVDVRIVELAKKYRMKYTRYADDLSFSTNDKSIINTKNDFLSELQILLNKMGFELNNEKTSFRGVGERHKVTGVIVNEKVNVCSEYYKKTRAMCYSLYTTGKYICDEEEVSSLNKLEGRLSFLNQVVNKEYEGSKIYEFHRARKEYSRFVFWKKFYNLDKPLIITEGYTDVLYLKAALKSMADLNKYPELVKKSGDKYEYNICFLKKTKQLKELVGVPKEGGAGYGDFFRKCYGINEKQNNQIYYYWLNGICKNNPKSPVVILLDNELGSNDNKKPVCDAIKCLSKKGKIDQEKEYYDMHLYKRIKGNLYIQIVPKRLDCKGLSDNSDIESLFDKKMLNQLNFNRKAQEGELDKGGLAKYVFDNYRKVDFSRFEELFDKMIEIINDYKLIK